MSELFVKDGEQLEIIDGNIKILQKKNGFRYGTDAVLLSEFASVKPDDRVLDMCTGTGIVPLLLYLKCKTASYSALEIQPEIYDMARRSAELSGLSDKVRLVLGDLKNHREIFAAQSFEVVTCNPPYMPVDTGKMCICESERLSRHEILCNLEDVISAAGWLLKDGGRFYMVHRADRLADIMVLMRKYKIEPKKLQLIHPKSDKEANLLLIEGQFGRKSGIKILKPKIMR